MSSPQITDFLAAFSGDNRFCLSLPILWTVSIDGVDSGAINSTLRCAGEDWVSTLVPANLTKSGNILPAQQVIIPGESSNFQAMTMGSGMGGFLPGYGLDSRSNFLERTLNINFLETKSDLGHEFFTPWQIAIGIKGLVESGVNLKSDIQVKQYDNQGNFRKGYHFFKAFPINVEGFTLNYENTDFVVKSVTFACQNYRQL